MASEYYSLPNNSMANDTCNFLETKSTKQLYTLCSSPVNNIQSKLLMNSPNFAAATEFQFVHEEDHMTNVNAIATSNRSIGAVKTTIMPLLTSIKNCFTNMLKPGMRQEQSNNNSISLEKNKSDLNRFATISNGDGKKTKSFVEQLDYFGLTSLLHPEQLHSTTISVDIYAKTKNLCTVEMEKDLSIVMCEDKKALKCIQITKSSIYTEAFRDNKFRNELLDSFEFVTYPDCMESEQYTMDDNNKPHKMSRTSSFCQYLNISANNVVNKQLTAKIIPCEWDASNLQSVKKYNYPQNISWTFLQNCLDNQYVWMILPIDNFSFEINNRSRSFDYSPSNLELMSNINDVTTTTTTTAITTMKRSRCISESSDDFICFELESDIDENDNASKLNVNTSGYDSDSDRSDNESDLCGKKVRFNIKPEVHIIHTWNYAHRQARKGVWEQMAVDRLRFEDRIKNFTIILNPIFVPEHRTKIFNERFKITY